MTSGTLDVRESGFDLRRTDRREWSIEMFGDGNPVPFFLAPHRFDSAERTRDSFAMALSGGQCYGVGMGPEPPVNPLWTRCSIDRSPTRNASVHSWRTIAGLLLDRHRRRAGHLDGTGCPRRRGGDGVLEASPPPSRRYGRGTGRSSPWCRGQRGRRVGIVGALVRWGPACAC